MTSADLLSPVAPAFPLIQPNSALSAPRPVLSWGQRTCRFCAETGMSILAKSFCAAMLCVVLRPGLGRAEGIDTEHIYAFMIGTDVGELGEREFQSETTGRFSRQESLPGNSME